MDDLISRQAAIAHAISGRTREFGGDKWIRVSEVRESLQTMPSAQPKTGRWQKIVPRGRVYRCDQCGNFLDFDGVNVGRGDANYCPNCGARMEEPADE